MTTPDAMTEGERIAEGINDTMIQSHGNRVPPSVRRLLATDIDAFIASKDAAIAEQAAEIERLRAGGWIRATDEWRKGEFWDTDRFLVALRVGRTDKAQRTTGHSVVGYHWEAEEIRIDCDEDYFEIKDVNGESWGWTLDDIEFYRPMKSVSDELAALLKEPTNDQPA